MAMAAGAFELAGDKIQGDSTWRSAFQDIVTKFKSAPAVRISSAPPYMDPAEVQVPV
jgi:hypothetical protein